MVVWNRCQKVFASSSFLLAALAGSPSRAADITLYTPLVENRMVHVGDPAIHHGVGGVGHHRHNNGSLYLEKGGAAIGEYHLISSVVSVDEERGADVREVFTLIKLAAGEIFAEVTAPMQHEASPSFKPGWSMSGTVVGGTGAYKHASGTYALRVTDDARYFQTDLHIDEPTPASPAAGR